MFIFSSNKDLGKLGKKYSNDLLCKFGLFCLQHSKTFDILHAFLRVTIAKLSTLKQVRPVYTASSYDVRTVSRYQHFHWGLVLE